MIPCLNLGTLLGPMNQLAVARVSDFEQLSSTLPQVDMCVTQFIHAGMYVRTLCVPAEHVLTGALVRIPTVLVVNGDVNVWTGEAFNRLTGHHALQCEANRKQVFRAFTDTWLTMSFPTKAKTVKEAEEEFTAEWSKLTTRRNEA